MRCWKKGEIPIDPTHYYLHFSDGPEKKLDGNHFILNTVLLKLQVSAPLKGKLLLRRERGALLVDGS